MVTSNTILVGRRVEKRSVFDGEPSDRELPRGIVRELFARDGVDGAYVTWDHGSGGWVALTDLRRLVPPSEAT